MAVLKLKESKVQSLADEFTAKVMTETYGERYTKLDNLEDDQEFLFRFVMFICHCIILS